MLDVILYFIRRERLYREPHTDTILELPHVRTVQYIVQFALAYQDNLQELLVWIFEITEQPDFFKHLGTELMGLVDDEYTDFSLLLPL
jgi:hypothetical protein